MKKKQHFIQLHWLDLLLGQMETHPSNANKEWCIFVTGFCLWFNIWEKWWYVRSTSKAGNKEKLRSKEEKYLLRSIEYFKGLVCKIGSFFKDFQEETATPNGYVSHCSIFDSFSLSCVTSELQSTFFFFLLLLNLFMGSWLIRTSFIAEHFIKVDSGWYTLVALFKNKENTQANNHLVFSCQ